MTVPAHFTTPTGKDHWHVLMRARAIENQLYVAAAAQIGETLPGQPAYGRSLIVDPWGVVVAQAPDEETVTVIRRARSRAPAEHPRQVAVAREPATERVPVADASLTHGVWLERVPELVAECVEEWELELGEPYEAGAAGYAVRAGLTDGTPAVLKLIYPHREAEHEADALELFGGNGAVRLLARDDARSAMLLERCEPGTALAESGGETALDVLVELLPKHWVRAGEPFHTLAEEAAWWIDELPEQWSNRAARSNGGWSTRRSTRSARCRNHRESRCC